MVIVPGALQKYIDLLERHVRTNAVNQCTETFAGLLKDQGRAAFEALEACKECRGYKSCDVLKLPNVHPYLEGFARQHGNDLEIRTRFGFHEQFLSRSIPAHFSSFITFPVYSAPCQCQGQGLRLCSAALRSPLTPSAAALSPIFCDEATKKVWVEKRGSVGVPLPNSDERSIGHQTLMKSKNTPPKFLSRVELQFVKRVSRALVGG